MKKNKKLDKIVAQALASSIKEDNLDSAKIKRLTEDFKKLPLEDAVYALSTFKKGLQSFEDKHTLTISAPVELPKEVISKLSKTLNSSFSILNSKFHLDSSLLAGFKFKIGDSIFDSSLRSSLEQLKK
jgi:F0F1-type ATP synthase delta subunit